MTHLDDMTTRQLSIRGAWEIAPAGHGEDGRRFFDYGIRHLEAVLGHGVRVAQHGLSVSAQGVLRGIHYAAGQAKYVTCVCGAAMDVVVDLRTWSPTFGRWDSVRLDDRDRHAVYLEAGLGHGFLALEPETTLMYLCSLPFDPATEREIHPLDPDLGIAWPHAEPTLSRRDRAAPTLRRARDAGLLPSWQSTASA